MQALWRDQVKPQKPVNLSMVTFPVPCIYVDILALDWLILHEVGINTLFTGDHRCLTISTEGTPT